MATAVRAIADCACPPQKETCNGRDDDCDNRIDENVGEGVRCEVGKGVCPEVGLTVCDGETGEIVCGATPGEAADFELCNDEDDDCDGRIDEGNPDGGMDCQTGLFGICSVGSFTCQTSGPNRGQLVCIPSAVKDQFEETCNGRDDDCDGEEDERGTQRAETCVRQVGSASVLWAP